MKRTSNIFKRCLILTALPLMGGVGGGLPAFASWDELALLVRGLQGGSLVLERDSRIQPSIYTTAVFFDYNNDGLLGFVSAGTGDDWACVASIFLNRNMRGEQLDVNYIGGNGDTLSGQRISQPHQPGVYISGSHKLYIR